MKIAEEDRKLLKEVCGQLDMDAVELIDFDKTGRLLRQLHDGIVSDENLASQLRLIKDDYRLRIIGMLKALIASRFDEDDVRIAAELAGDIDKINTAELTGLYRRVGVKFRNRFPASFKYTGLRKRRFADSDWKEHKI